MTALTTMTMQTTALDSQSDLDVLRLYFEGGMPDAFAELVHRYQHFAYRTAFARTGNRAQAEEVVQEAFLKLAGTPGRRALTRPGELRPWFLGIVSNVARNAVRTERRVVRRANVIRSGRMALNMAEQPEQNGPSHLDTETRELLEQAISSLNVQYRLPLILHYMGKLSQLEVARIIGVNQSSVARRIDEALNQLKRCLRNTGVECSAVALPILLKAPHLLDAPVSLQQALVHPSFLRNAAAANSASLKASASAARIGKWVAITTLVTFVAGAAYWNFRQIPRSEHPNTVPTALVNIPEIPVDEVSHLRPRDAETVIKIAGRWNFEDGPFEDELPRTEGWIYGTSNYSKRKVLATQGEETLKYFLKLPIRYGRTMVVDILASAGAQGRQLMVPVWVTGSHMHSFEFSRMGDIYPLPEKTLLNFRYYIKDNYIVSCDTRNTATPTMVQKFENSNTAAQLTLCCANWCIAEISVREIKDVELPPGICDSEKFLGRALERRTIMDLQIEFMKKRDP